MRAVELRILLILFFFITSIVCLNLKKASEDCLNGSSLPRNQEISCLTLNGVKINKIERQNQTFYCIYYEKKTGNRNEFDVLSFDLHEDYDLKYTGSNVVSNDAVNPKFKLFDSRSKPSYKGRFAFSSENPAFDIYKVTINDMPQVCYQNGKQSWPSFIVLDESFEQSQESSTSKEYLTTTTPSSRSTTTWLPHPDSNLCGIIKKIDSFGNYLALSSSPGEFPWTVSIYRYFNEDEESYYKCAGTIIDKRTILTSVNCLLDDGLLLKRDDLKVYASPFSLAAKMHRVNLYSIAKVITHFDYNFNLENNIAALKLSRDIEFNDYVQPICVPENDYSVLGKIGKLAGFGKSTSLHQPKSDILVSAEYEVQRVNDNTFEAENTSGNSRISDIGSGLYINETNRWVLGGIMSKKTRKMIGDVPNHIFTFTNVPQYYFWIQVLAKDEA